MLVHLLVASMVPLLDVRLVVATVDMSVVRMDWSGCWMVDTMVACSKEKVIKRRFFHIRIMR